MEVHLCSRMMAVMHEVMPTLRPGTAALCLLPGAAAASRLAAVLPILFCGTARVFVLLALVLHLPQFVWGVLPSFLVVSGKKHE